MSKKVALLCTGNEIIEGRVLNTNAQLFSGLFSENGIITGSHLTVPDDEAEMDQALTWLLKDHDSVITCGGLGPTSDDKTRNSVARVAQKELVFNEANWQVIQQRLQSYNIDVHPSNRQQAYYPAGAHIIDNGFGTAAGFMTLIENKPVFVLPGPPHECLPMLEQFVIPSLLAQKFGIAPLRYFARLIGVSEADIASRVDAALTQYEVETAFCWQYPFCDILVKTKTESDLHAISSILDALLQTYLVAHQKKSASECVREKLQEKQLGISLRDECSGGLLHASLFSPETQYLLNTEHVNIIVSLKGLRKWLDQAPHGGNTTAEISITGLGAPFHISREIPYRGNRVRDFVVEYACFCILKLLNGDY